MVGKNVLVVVGSGSFLTRTNMFLVAGNDADDLRSFQSVNTNSANKVLPNQTWPRCMLPVDFGTRLRLPHGACAFGWS